MSQSLPSLQRNQNEEVELSTVISNQTTIELGITNPTVIQVASSDQDLIESSPSPPPPYETSEEPPPYDPPQRVHFSSQEAESTSCAPSQETNQRDPESESTEVEIMEDSCCYQQRGKLVPLFVVVAIVFISVLCSSYSDLHYYEMGFSRNKLNGKTDSSKVYSSGRHWIGPSHSFKVFKADAHIEYFKELAVFNKEKMEIHITCSLQYFLRKEDLSRLYRKYGVAYKAIMRSTILAAIRNNAAGYSIDEYLKSRTLVAKGLLEAVKDVVDGKCCRASCTDHKCRTGCVSYDTCTDKQRGMFAEVRFLQLQDVKITAEQSQRYLTQVLEQEKKDTEVFKQGKTVTEKETELLRKEVEVLAEEIKQNATVKANLISAEADVSATAVLENARTSGLEIMFSTLNITSSELKKSLDYVRSLNGHSNVNIYIGFSHMVAREGP